MNFIKRVEVKYLLIFFFFTTINVPAAFAQNKKIKTETFKVFGECEMCKTNIETALLNTGVKKAQWNQETKMLTVAYDTSKHTRNQLEKALAAIGYDTDNEKALAEAYNQLPDCCHYERVHVNNNVPLSKDIMHQIRGVVLEENAKGQLTPLIKATVRPISNSNTVNTDSAGVFNLSIPIPSQVIISYVGLISDTVNIISHKEVKVILKEAFTNKLEEVVLSAKKRQEYISMNSLLNTINLNSKELTKAACCNLCESFETTPSIDIGYSDAVTGIRQIQLLGLSGNYIQLLTEGMPEFRGLSGSFGLTFIPGTWIEGVQIIKGAGSVVNGFESISGQLNVEEVKPDEADKLFINGYANNMGRLETTVNLSKKINSNLSTLLMLHSNGVLTKNDNNYDGYLDMPKGRQFNLINRWKYANTKGIFSQLAIKAISDNRLSGSVLFNPNTDKLKATNYGVGMEMEQYAITGKLGYIFPNEKYKSVGIMFSALQLNNRSYYGTTLYNGKQKTFYTNFIYQSIIGNSNHKYKVGLSYINDTYSEVFKATRFNRTESIPGSFFEYTFTAPKLTAMAGIRADYHNQYNFIGTVRVHLKYNFSEHTSLRLSGGNGFRVANIFAENTGLFASSREYSILNSNSNWAYGLNPEKAWSMGLNFLQAFTINHKKGSINIDVYRTDFKNQLVVDVDANPQQILFYNLTGKSYSNSVLAELNYEPIKKLNLRLAYRWLDVQTDYTSGKLQKPLVAKNRAFINIGYETNDKWSFDFTTQWIGEKRLPNTSTNPIDKQFISKSPDYIQMNAQVAKQINLQWNVYVGAENITNYTQKKLFIDAANPFSRYFDASMVWGPINNRVFYIGFRYGLK